MISKKSEEKHNIICNSIFNVKDRAVDDVMSGVLSLYILFSLTQIVCMCVCVCVCVCVCLRPWTVGRGQQRGCKKQDGWGNHEVAQGDAEFPSQAYPTPLQPVKNKSWQFTKMLNWQHSHACSTQLDVIVIVLN